MEIPREEENFFRVSKLVYNEIPAQLRSFFKHKWKIKSHQDWDDSPTSGNNLWRKLSPGTKSKKWNDEIKNKIKEGSSLTWDCTVLFEVLLYLGMTTNIFSLVSTGFCKVYLTFLKFCYIS